MTTLKTVIFYAAFAALSNAQAGPGGGMVGNGPETPTGTYSTLVGTDTTSGPIYTNSYGPWNTVDYLEGTWTTKSGTVITGPGFYDPIDELLIEPALPGMCYSFTKDGYWEEAIYQVTGNGTNPKCATAAIQFQHGQYNLTDNGTLILTPYDVDGRQLLSDPCGDSDTESDYSRYKQAEKYSKFEVYIDLYHGRYRLDLYRFDGSPMPPMFLAYKPPQMLPTTTMNPTDGASALNGQHTASADGSSDNGTASATAESGNTRRRVRRSLINRSRTTATKVKTESSTQKLLWWSGIFMIGAGAVGWVVLQ